jgi:hypothetical protein
VWATFASTTRRAATTANPRLPGRATVIAKKKLAPLFVAPPGVRAGYGPAGSTILVDGMGSGCGSAEDGFESMDNEEEGADKRWVSVLIYISSRGRGGPPLTVVVME